MAMDLNAVSFSFGSNEIIGKRTKTNSLIHSYSLKAFYYKYIQFLKVKNLICKLRNQWFIYHNVTNALINKLHFFIVNDGIEQIQRHPSITYQKKCLKCNKFDCTFADCNESNNVVCLPVRHLNKHLLSFTFNVKDYD